MHFTKLFKYLGSMITPDLKSDTDVDTRIKKAAQAFGALRSVACDRHLATKIRGICYKVLMVTVLLHGAESWSLTEAHMQALTAFHRRCVRAMCNVNLRSTRNFKIKTATLEEKIGVETIKMSCHRRLTGWAGEVLRTPMDRPPRELLTAWLPHKRAVGATLNWGRTLKKVLEFNKSTHHLPFQPFIYACEPNRSQGQEQPRPSVVAPIHETQVMTRAHPGASFLSCSTSARTASNPE